MSHLRSAVGLVKADLIEMCASQKDGAVARLGQAGRAATAAKAA